MRIDQTGVSNVVSLIMIAGIIISLLGMLFTTYLPAWGKDTETRTQSEVLDSMMDMKTGMEMLGVAGDPGASMTTKITLGSNGGPLFGFGRMTGSLQLHEQEGIMDVSSTDLDDGGVTNFAQSRGRIVYESYNVEVEDMTISLEHGAIIREQNGVPILKGTPNIALESDTSTGERSMYVYMSNLEGSDDSYTGTGSYMARMVLTADQLSAYDVTGDEVRLRLYTPYQALWDDLLTSLADEEGLVRWTEGSLIYDYRVVQAMDDDSAYVDLFIRSIDRLEIRIAVYEVSIN